MKNTNLQRLTINQKYHYLDTKKKKRLVWTNQKCVGRECCTLKKKKRQQTYEWIKKKNNKILIYLKMINTLRIKKKKYKKLKINVLKNDSSNNIKQC